MNIPERDAGVTWPFRGQDSMDPRFADLLREAEEATRQQGGAIRLARESGQFLNILAKATRANHILEVGTGTGYLSLWLAEAAAANEGVLTTIEGDPWQYELAKTLLARSPHAEQITLHTGDPLEVLPVMEGPFQLVLLNADKTQTLAYFRTVVDQVSAGALICCDKAISLASALGEYLSYVHDRPGLSSVLVPIGDGIELTYKVP